MMPSQAPNAMQVNDEPERLFSHRTATSSNNRFELPAQEYLGRHHVQTYLTDLLTRFPEPMHTAPLHTLSQYFQAVAAGTHIAGREFAFMNATPHNRLCFVRLAEHTLQAQLVDSNTTPGSHLSCADCHSLLQLLCPDLPLYVTEEAVAAAAALARMRAPPKAAAASSAVRTSVTSVRSSSDSLGSSTTDFDTSKWTFADFLRALHVSFLHREYLSRARTRVFAALGLWTAAAQVQCFASCRAMAAALVADGEQAVPESSMKRAMAAAHQESYQCTCLSRYDLFVGALCMDPEVRTQYRREVTAMKDHADSIAAIDAAAAAAAAELEHEMTSSSSPLDAEASTAAAAITTTLPRSSSSSSSSLRFKSSSIKGAAVAPRKPRPPSGHSS